MTSMHFQAWNATEGRIADVPLSANSTVELRCLPGASGIHLALRDDHSVILRAEIPATRGEVVPLRIDIDHDDRPRLSSERFQIFTLPPDARYEPAELIRPTAADAPIDIVVIVDGTLRNWEDNAAPRLLDDSRLRAAHADALVELVTALAAGRDARAAVFAFGDQDEPPATAPDLQPQYVLDPPDHLDASGITQLRDKLLALRSTPGGDFVDALADALHMCADPYSDLRWRDGVRKLVIVSGDSPGFSLLEPLPKEADLRVRRWDVDTEALALHRLGVEIVTIYHRLPEGHALASLAHARPLLAAARAQYARLASLPELAFMEPGFQPAEAAAIIANLSSLIARGASIGELVEVRAADGFAAPL